MLDFDHQNLVRLIGVAMQQRPWLVVLEYMRVRLTALSRFSMPIHQSSIHGSLLIFPILVWRP